MRCEVVCRNRSLRKAAGPKEEAKSREVLFSETGNFSRMCLGPDSDNPCQLNRSMQHPIAS